MYISSDGTRKDVSQMNTEYLINALAKCYREIFTSKTEEEYKKYLDNIINIKLELDSRIGDFIIDKIDKEQE